MKGSVKWVRTGAQEKQREQRWTVSADDPGSSKSSEATVARFVLNASSDNGALQNGAGGYPPAE